MIDVNYIHSFHQCTSFCPLHGDNVIIFQCYTRRIFWFQNLITIAACRRLSVCQHSQNIVPKFYRQFLMWKQCCHTKLCDRGEDTLHTAKRNLTLCFSAKLICHRCRHFITHSIRNNHKYLGIWSFDARTIKFFLLRYFQNLAIGCQFVCTHIRPVVTQFT